MVRHIGAGSGHAQDVTANHGPAHLTHGIEGIINFVTVGPTPGRPRTRSEIVLDRVQVGNVERNEAKFTVAAVEPAGLPDNEVLERGFRGRADLPGNQDDQ